ncbi:MAG TPA: peptidylprolyl isomerase [Chitinophagaceae bacterium]|nr:peptidylprolyl isomerase [Chitinophagaceae bacterium]
MSNSPRVESGTKVRVHYTGRFVNGETFDSSRERDPLEFTVGEGTVIPGFEDALIHMHPGEHKTVQISPEMAYGPYQEELLLVFPASRFPPGTPPVPGLEFQLQGEDGQTLRVTVKEVRPDEVILDANHPLAGKDLIFDLELMALDDLTQTGSGNSVSPEGPDQPSIP